MYKSEKLYTASDLETVARLASALCKQTACLKGEGVEVENELDYTETLSDARWAVCALDGWCRLDEVRELVSLATDVLEATDSEQGLNTLESEEP